MKFKNNDFFNNAFGPRASNKRATQYR